MGEEKKKEFIGQVGNEQIKLWKEKHLELHQLTVKEHVCYLKPLDRATLSYALSMIEVGTTSGQGQKIDLGRLAKMGEVVLQNCWLGGSEEIRKNDRLWVSACVTAGELIEFEEAELKKL